MAATIITLSGIEKDPEGLPASGSIGFTLSTNLIDASGNIVYNAQSVWARVDPVTGLWSATLVATKGDGLTPSGATWHVQKKVGNGVSFTIELDADDGATQNLADLSPAPDGTAIVYGATLAQLATETAARIAGDAITLAHAPGHEAGGSDDLYASQGNYLSTRVETMNRYEAASSNGLTSGSIRLTYFTPDRTLTVSSLLICSGGVGGAGISLTRLGIYTVDGSNNCTLVARTASNVAILSGIDTVYTEPLATAGGYPASYQLVRGTRYALGVICVFSSTAPQVRAMTPGVGLTQLAPLLARIWSGQTDLVTSAPFASTSALSQSVWMGAV